MYTEHARPMQRTLWKRRATRTLERAAIVATFGCAIATTVGFLGSWWWVFDMFSHFRPHYAVILLLTGIGLGIAWRLRIAAVAGGVMCVNVALVAPLYLSSPAAPAVGAVPLRVVSFNIDYRSTAFDDIAGYLRRADADVMFLVEATPDAVARARRSLPGYKLVGHAESGPWGLVAFSRVPIRSYKLARLAGEQYPALELVLEHKKVSYTLLGIHPPPPIGGGWSRDRDKALAEVGSWAKKQTGHAAIIGDFNATPWAAPMRQLIDTSGFENSQRGFGLQATWPSGAGPLSIPIDHCLHSKSLTTVARSVGSGYYGSDHRPLVVELAPRKTN